VDEVVVGPVVDAVDVVLDGGYYTKSRRQVALLAVEVLETERSEG
jgi:hypothetical protein